MSTRNVTFTANGTWTAPAGVNRITVTGVRGPSAFQPFMTGILDQYGNAYKWGSGVGGELGNGSSVTRSSPVLVAGNLSWTRVSTGGFGLGYAHGAIASNGKCYAWGENQSGELGDGTRTNRASPVPVVGGLLFRDILSATTNVGDFMIGITTDNKAYGWGRNTNGQLGCADELDHSSPTLVVGGLQWQKIVTGGSGTVGGIIGLTTTGVAYGWGDNPQGFLGTGNAVKTSTPTAVLGGLTFTDLVTSDGTSFGLTTAGAIYSWGSGNAGQLGNNNNSAVSSPVPVAGGLKFQAIFPAPFSNNCWGLTTTGVMYGWGDNFNGVVGDGNNSTGTSSPVPVAGNLKFVKLITTGAGENQTAVLGLTADGTVYAWGNNDKGQIGDGTTTTRSSPTLCVGNVNFIDINSTLTFQDTGSFFGLTSNGQIYAWGANDRGQLGVGDVVARSSPTLVVGELQGMAQAFTTVTKVNVTPNTAYTITKSAFFCTFNGAIVGTQLDKIIITYEQ